LIAVNFAVRPNVRNLKRAADPHVVQGSTSERLTAAKTDRSFDTLAGALVSQQT